MIVDNAQADDTISTKAGRNEPLSSRRYAAEEGFEAGNSPQA